MDTIFFKVAVYQGFIFQLGTATLYLIKYCINIEVKTYNLHGKRSFS